MEWQKEARKLKRRNLKYRAELKDLARDYMLLKTGDGICAEIGVDEGDFSEKILRQTEVKRLHLVDSWQHMEEFTDRCFCGASEQDDMEAKYQRVVGRFEEEVVEGVVSIHRATSEEAAKSFRDESLDWLYLDANHLYEFVRDDIEGLWPKVKPGGWFCGDDYGIAGWWDWGVTKAVDEFVEKHGLQIEVKFTQFMVRKPE